jgi:hypothetical protein
LTKFDFEWVHKQGRDNLVADALSRKGVDEYVAAISLIEADFLGKIKDESLNDSTYQRLVKQVGDGLVRRYWPEDELLRAKRNFIYVPAGSLRR